MFTISYYSYLHHTPALHSNSVVSTFLNRLRSELEKVCVCMYEYIVHEPKLTSEHAFSKTTEPIDKA